MRSVANHGIRVLPYRFHSKHDIKENDNRWFSSGRWASAYYDGSPAVAQKMEVGLGIWRGEGGGGGLGVSGFGCGFSMRRSFSSSGVVWGESGPFIFRSFSHTCSLVYHDIEDHRKQEQTRLIERFAIAHGEVAEFRVEGVM